MEDCAQSLIVCKIGAKTWAIVSLLMVLLTALALPHSKFLLEGTLSIKDSAGNVLMRMDSPVRENSQIAIQLVEEKLRGR